LVFAAGGFATGATALVAAAFVPPDTDFVSAVAFATAKSRANTAAL
jgi:hypothetical protein